MTDEISPGELARRLDEILRVVQSLVSRAEYTADQRHIEHRFGEIEHDITDKRRVHDRDIHDLREELKAVRAKVEEESKSDGVNFRQAIYMGLVPGIVMVITLLVSVLLAFKGGK